MNKKDIKTIENKLTFLKELKNDLKNTKWAQLDKSEVEVLSLNYDSFAIVFNPYYNTDSCLFLYDTDGEVRIQYDVDGEIIQIVSFLNLQNAILFLNNSGIVVNLNKMA